MSTTAANKAKETDKKLSEAILFVAKHCANHYHFGAVKLNKILFFADFISYIRHGASVTNAEYMKLWNGPVPRRFMPVKQALFKSGRAKMEPKPMINGVIQKRLIPLDEPDVSVFSARDIEMLYEAMDILKDATAQEVSDLSHDRAWRVADPKETIPYETAFVSDQPPKPAQLKRANELSHKYGWDAAAA